MASHYIIRIGEKLHRLIEAERKRLAVKGRKPSRGKVGEALAVETLLRRAEAERAGKK